MEIYKKKSLNFMGYSRDLRKIERETQRFMSRQQRLSVFRDDESLEEKNNVNKLPTRGIPKPQAGSRVQMLQKWKQEKMVKKQQESKLKKPVFKVGVTKPDPLPSLGSKPLFALDSSRLHKSSYQGSNSKLYVRKLESLNRSDAKTSAKISNSQSFVKKIDTANLKTSEKGIKIQPSQSKIVVPSKPESNGTKNKESGIHYLKPKVDTTTKVVNQNQLPSIKKQPMVVSKPLETKKESRLQPLNVRSKVATLAKDTKSSIPSSGLPKPTTTGNINKVSNQIPKPTASKIPGGNSNAKHIPGKITVVKSIQPRQPPFSKGTATQQKSNVTVKTYQLEPKVLNKPDKDVIPTTFDCDLSQIEPVKDPRKSFAPEGFKFQPPTLLNSSLFLEDGPSAIFLRNKSQLLRTSTPIQSPSSEKSSPKIGDAKCLESENIEFPNDRNTQSLKQESTLSPKITDKKLEPSNKCDLETLLSSSLESVSLNVVKPIDCKQPIKFELPEVIITKLNQEEMPLSSKIMHPEHLGDTPSVFDGVINPPILRDLTRFEKTETETDSKQSLTLEFPEVVPTQNEEEMLLSSKIIQPEYSLLLQSENVSIQLDLEEGIKTSSRTDSGVTQSLLDGAINPPFLPDLMETEKNTLEIESKQSFRLEFPEVMPVQSQAEIFLPSKIKQPEYSVVKENPPIQLDVVEIVKAEKTSSGTNSTVDDEITVPFPEDDSEMHKNKEISDPTFLEPNKIAGKSFIQKQENNYVKIPERKGRNFRGSEKPVLASINESLENTPQSAIKNKLLDSVFTPRRSLRLAKLSGNFSSLENLLDSPKLEGDKDKANLKGDFTPRRSLRFSSAENLFDVKRPTLYGSPEDDIVPKLSSRVTYDFDGLSSETANEAKPRTTRSGKVSLLYTPPNKSRASIMRQSIKGDLMSFSPNS